MRRILAYRCATATLIALAASPVTADMRGTSTNDHGSKAREGGTFVQSALDDDVAGDPFALAGLAETDDSSAGEMDGLADSLRTGGTMDLVPSAFDGVDGERGLTNPQLNLGGSLPAGGGDADRDSTGWTPAFGLEGTGFESSTAPDPTTVVGDVRIRDLAWVDGSPGQSELTPVPVPGTFILGVLGLGLARFTVRRFT